MKLVVDENYNSVALSYHLGSTNLKASQFQSIFDKTAEAQRGSHYKQQIDMISELFLYQWFCRYVRS